MLYFVYTLLNNRKGCKMKVLLLILLCFVLSGCATFGDYGSGYQNQGQGYSGQTITVITQPSVVEQPNYPAPDRYLYQK